MKFAKKCLKNDKYKNWFSDYDPTDQLLKTRSIKPDLLLEPVKARTKEFKKSPISYLTNLINEDYCKAKQTE